MIKLSKKLNNSSFKTFVCAKLTFPVKCYPLFRCHVVENNISMSGNQWIKGWFVCDMNINEENIKCTQER